MTLDTEQLTHLKIVDAEDGSVVSEWGMVQTHGPTAKVYHWDETRHRMVAKDILDEAVLKRGAKTSTLTGVSRYLRRTARLPKATATMTYKLHHNTKRASAET